MSADWQTSSQTLIGNTGFHGSRLGSGRETTTIVLLIVMACVLAGVLLITNGNLMAAAIPLVGIAILFLSFYRLDWGFNVLLGAILLFDQYSQHASQPLTLAVHYFQNLKENPYLPSADAAVVSPFELHLLLVVFVWLVYFIIHKQGGFRTIPLWQIVLLLFAWLAFSFSYGMIKGGNLLPGLWESRALVYLGVFYFLVPQIVKTRQHLRSIVWVCIAVVSFKAFQGIVYFVSSGFSFWNESYMTASQEDSLFIVLLMMLLMTFTFLGGESKQKYTLLLLFLPLLLGFFSGNRRATYVSFAISTIALAVLLPRKQQKQMLLVVISLVVVFGIYLGVFWNNGGLLGWPAQQVKSILFEDKTLMTSRNYSSNYYREVEKYNIEFTIRDSPVTGIGFGVPYATPINLFLKFGLSEYITHNSLLWLFMKTGAIGFFLFMVFLNTFLFRGASVFSRLNDPYLKVLVALCLIAVINQMVVTYVEMHFTYYRNMSFLGILMGLIPVIESINTEESQASLKKTASPKT